MGEARRYRSLVIIFIIILLLHTIILWMVFIAPLSDSPHADHHAPADQKPEDPTHNQLINPQPWKALQAKPSAPVIFKNTQSISTPSLPSKEAPEPIQEPMRDPVLKEKPKAIPPKKQILTDSNARVPVLTHQEEHKHDTQPDQPLIKAPTMAEKAESKKSEATKETQAPSLKKFSFNTLAEGFAQHMHNQGTDEYTMKGADKGKATAEQLKYAQYGSKICTTITNAFVTNKRKILFASQEKHDAIIKILINKDGTLKEAFVLKTSTVPSIDLSIIAVIKEAAQGFPPLPEFFRMDCFPLTILFNNAMQIIEHPEQSYWSL